jgi:hypothetical protein
MYVNGATPRAVGRVITRVNASQTASMALFRGFIDDKFVVSKVINVVEKVILFIPT